jgi:hypothetical protein
MPRKGNVANVAQPNLTVAAGESLWCGALAEDLAGAACAFRGSVTAANAYQFPNIGGTNYTAGDALEADRWGVIGLPIGSFGRGATARRSSRSASTKGNVSCSRRRFMTVRPPTAGARAVQHGCAIGR